jgi:large conductance mechanosensitive channel
MIRLFDKFKKKEEVKEETPKKSDEVLLLEEIRDLLKKSK